MSGSSLFTASMYLDIRGIDSCIDFEDFGRQLREHVRSGTGLTIGVGMGPTKTLAKSAQWHRKNDHSSEACLP